MSTKDDILRMHHSGIAPETIADEMDLPPATVLAILLRLGVDEDQLFGEASREIGPETRRGICALYGNRRPVGQIARRYNLKPLDIYQILAEEGVPVRRHRAQAALARLRMEADAVQLYLDGMPVYDIVREVGMSQQTIHHVLERYNVPLRQPKVGYNQSKPRTGPMVHPQTLLDELLERQPE